MKEKILNLKQKTNVNIKEIKWVVKTFPKENEKQLEDEVKRLQNTNHEFFLKLTNQNSDINSHQSDEVPKSKEKEEDFSFDDFINKLI